MKTSLRSLALTAAAAVTALAGTVPAQAVPAHAKDVVPKVVVSKVSASEKATTHGTDVTVTYTLRNRSKVDRPARAVRVYLVRADGTGRRGIGRAKAPALAAGARRTFTVTRTVGPKVPAGDYATRVCFRGVGGSCATTGAAGVTVAPAAITPSVTEVVVPFVAEGEVAPGRVTMTNTGQSRTGTLRLSIADVEPEWLPTGPAMRRAARSSALGRAAEPEPAGVYEVAATTCGPSLTVGESCTVDVARSDSGIPVANLDAVLTITGALGATTEVAVTGPVQVTPALSDFGQVEVGDEAFRTLTVDNRGTEALQVSNGQFVLGGGSFSFAPGRSFTCAGDIEGGPVEVPAGGSCTISVRFAPTTLGPVQDLGILFTTSGLVGFGVQGVGTPGEVPVPVRPAPTTFGADR